MINKDATVGWAANYQACGLATPTTELITNPLRFPGQYYDQESGLHHNFMRDYDPRTGAYKTQDPIGVFQTGSNRYGYVYGNPVHLKDPTGSIALPFPHPGALVAGPLIVVLYPPLRDFFNNIIGQIPHDIDSIEEERPQTICMPKVKKRDDDPDPCDIKLNKWQLEEAGIGGKEHEVKSEELGTNKNI